MIARRMFRSIVVGTDGSDTARQAVREATELAAAIGAAIELVSAYEPVAGQRLREEAREAPPDLQWMINVREDVEATLREAAEEVEAAGVPVRTYAREGDPADAILDVAEERGRRPDRGRQQGHDGREALPAGLRAQQGLPPRALQRADHPHGALIESYGVTARAASSSPAP